MYVFTTCLYLISCFSHVIYVMAVSQLDPRDVAMVIEKLDKGKYTDVHAFEADLNVIFHNAKVCMHMYSVFSYGCSAYYSFKV